jgi:hypothetical protein
MLGAGDIYVRGWMGGTGRVSRIFFRIDCARTIPTGQNEAEK